MSSKQRNKRVKQEVDEPGPGQSEQSKRPRRNTSQTQQPEKHLRKADTKDSAKQSSPPNQTGKKRKGKNSDKASESSPKEAKEGAPALAAQAPTPPDTDKQEENPFHMDGDDMDQRANSALQGLLRKLGAGFEDLMAMSMMSGSRFKAIVTNLRQMDDEASQLGALTELCEVLSISSEDTLASVPIETLVPLLVQCLNCEHNPDMMLLAARALTFMADVLPPSCGAIVRHGAVSAFCQRLLTIEYIDLAEQSLMGLEKLSRDYAQSLLQQGGLQAVLSYLDFFPTGVQRTAVSTAANICRGLTPEHASAVTDAVPILTNLLTYQDAKIVDSACMALSHIAEALSNNAGLLKVLSDGNLFSQVLELISLSETGTSTLSLNTYYSLIKLLATCASASPAVARQLLERGMLGVIKTLLSGSSLLPNSTASSTTSMLRSADQLFAVLSLACELLPPLPESSAVMLQNLPALPAGNAASSDDRAKALKEDPALGQMLCHDVLPILLNVYSATVMPQVRHKCLSVMLRLMAHSAPETLKEALSDMAISSFIASLLSARDGATAAYGVHMAEVLMAKLPKEVTPYFIKEGVAHGMEQLSHAPPSSGPTSPAPSAPQPAPAAVPTTATGTSGGMRATRSSSRLKEALKGEGEASAPKAAPPPPPPSAASPTMQRTTSVSATSGLRAALATRAQKFKSQHFGSGPGGLDALETEGLAALKALSSKLGKDPGAVQELLDLISSSSTDGAHAVALPGSSSSNNAISVFELINSGVIRVLCDYLQGKDLQGGKGTEKALLQRQQQFVASALAPDSGPTPPMLPLVRKLQGALASAESFPVMCSRLAPSASMGGRGRLGGSLSRMGSMGGGGGLQPSNSLSSGLAALAQPFKLRLCKHSTERQLRDYSTNTVLIEPLASMTAIEDFLWPRVQRPAGMPAPAEAAVGLEPAGRTGPTAARAGSGAAGKAGTAPTPASRTASTPAAAANEGRRRRSSGGSGAAVAGGRTASDAAAGGGKASQAQPIPNEGAGRRMTRAHARAEAQARAEQRRSMEEEESEDAMDEDDDEDEGMDGLMMDENDDGRSAGGHGGLGNLDHEGMFDEDDEDEDDEDEDMDEDEEDDGLRVGSM